MSESSWCNVLRKWSVRRISVVLTLVKESWGIPGRTKLRMDNELVLGTKNYLGQKPDKWLSNGTAPKKNNDMSPQFISFWLRNDKDRQFIVYCDNIVCYWTVQDVQLKCSQRQLLETWEKNCRLDPPRVPWCVRFSQWDWAGVSRPPSPCDRLINEKVDEVVIKT